jgi:transcriptional regulator with XRE-family HTH domain
MGHLTRLIDEYKDAHGAPSDSSIARAIGSSPQTISSWRKRGIKEPPSPETVRRLAQFIGRDYERVVLRAALLDAGWIEEDPPAPPENDETSGTQQTA